MSFKTSLTANPPNVSSAISQFTTPLIPLLTPSKTSELDESLSSSWRPFLDTVASTPHENSGQKHLVEFLEGIRTFEGKEGEEVKIWGEVFKWENLPLFGPQVREWWDITEPDPSATNVKEEDKQKWINQSAFLAQLTSQSKLKGDAFDFALYGVWALRSAFEEEVEGGVEGYVVDAASVWVCYAGRALQDRSTKGEEWEGKIARGGGKVEGKEWRGLNAERWAGWVEGLRGSEKGKEALKTVAEKF